MPPPCSLFKKALTPSCPVGATKRASRAMRGALARRGGDAALLSGIWVGSTHTASVEGCYPEIAEEILADQVVIIPLAPSPLVVAEWRDQLQTDLNTRRGAPPSPELWYRTDL